MLNYIALFFIVFLILLGAAAVVFLGSLPGKIARGRQHPYPDAVNVASWVGLATGVFWPIALIWAFLPFPNPTVALPTDGAEPSDELAKLRTGDKSLRPSSTAPYLLYSMNSEERTVLIRRLFRKCLGDSNPNSRRILCAMSHSRPSAGTDGKTKLGCILRGNTPDGWIL
jgi:hypothetical protein